MELGGNKGQLAHDYRSGNCSREADMGKISTIAAAAAILVLAADSVLAAESASAAFSRGSLKGAYVFQAHGLIQTASKNGSNNSGEIAALGL
jgi:tRNA-dihydrouridine synthase